MSAHVYWYNGRKEVYTVVATVEFACVTHHTMHLLSLLSYSHVRHSAESAGGGGGGVSRGTTLESLHQLARQRAERRKKEREWTDKSAREICNEQKEEEGEGEGEEGKKDICVEERSEEIAHKRSIGKRKTRKKTVLPTKRRISEADD